MATADAVTIIKEALPFGRQQYMGPDRFERKIFKNQLDQLINQNAD
jgi:hypothetical protein